MKYPITLMRLVVEEPAGCTLSPDDSWILNAHSTYQDLVGYGFLDPTMTTNYSRRIFEELSADPEVGFVLELGVILPDLFPNLEDAQEYTASISDGVSERVLCFSNAMARLRFRLDDSQRHALMPRRLLAEVAGGKVQSIPKEAAVEYISTVVTARYNISGTDAQDALESNCDDCIQDIVRRISVVLEALRVIDNNPGRIYSLGYTHANLTPFYFVLKGKTEELRHGWLSPHFGRTMLKAPLLDAASSIGFRDLVSGKIKAEPVDSLIQFAASCIDGGVLEYALLLLAIAAETALQHFVHAQVLAAGASKNKLKDTRRDLTFNVMLNAVLFTAAPASHKPDPSLIDQINCLRQLRNDFVHNGKKIEDAKVVQQLLTDTQKFTEYLKQIPIINGAQNLDAAQ